MTTKIEKIEVHATLDYTANKSISGQFIVFVAGGTRPIISFGNFTRAERLALIIAGLLNVRMEVFDSMREICYFIEPSPSERFIRSLKDTSS